MFNIDFPPYGISQLMDPGERNFNFQYLPVTALLNTGMQIDVLEPVPEYA